MAREIKRGRAAGETPGPPSGRMAFASGSETTAPPERRNDAKAVAQASVS